MDLYIYARQSQYRGGGLSPNCEIQVAECQEWADEGAHRVVGIFKDVDISASQYSTRPRKDYERMLEGLRRGEAEGVVVTEMPRLYRRLEELLDLIQMATTTRLQHILTTDNSGYDLSTGEGVHNAVSAVNNAALESRRLSDRIRRKKRAQARRGRYAGGPRPYGFEGAIRDEHGNVINRHRIGVAIIEHEADVIREVVARLIAGESMRSIVTLLNERGERTSTGKLFEMTNLKRLVTSKRVIGVRTHDGVDYPAEWPAILSREEWEQVQLILRSEKALEERREARSRRHLLTGFLECGVCGAKLTGRRRGRDGTLHLIYSCQVHDTRGRRKGCGRLSRSAEPMNELITEAVLYRYDSPELAAALAGTDESEGVKTLLTTYNAQKLKLNQLVEDYATGLLNREQLALAKAIVEDSLEKTRSQLSEMQTGRALAAVPAGQSVREAWEAADVDWRRSLIELVVEKVIVHPGRPGGRRWKDASGREWSFDPEKIEIVWKL
jgi:site-specific DNA recombinase